MLKHLAIALTSVLGIATALAEAQTPTPWRDPSPHRVTSVTVADGVDLEVLDWGGSGRDVVLLAGSGNSAHVFDDLAPKLVGCCHVYGVTRRGHGSSSRPPSGYDEQQMANDLLRVLATLKVERPVLIGHSAAGGEMTTLAREHSDRLGGLVYMDAIADLEDDPPADAEWLALQQKLPPGVNTPPSCGRVDRSTFEAFQTTFGCRLGFVLPVAELRQIFEDDGGRVGAARMPEWVSRAMGQGQAFRKNYSNIKVPVLALLQFASTTEAFLAAQKYQPKDDSEREAIDRFIARTRIVLGRWTSKLTGQVPNARVVNLGPVGHYLFITRESEVLQHVLPFLAERPR